MVDFCANGEGGRSLKTIIAGTRTIVGADIAWEAMRNCPWAGEITEVVCGESEYQVKCFLRREREGNPDIFGAVWALSKNIPVKYFAADWHRFGRSAGPIRNREMAHHGEALVLIWNETSKGSENMLKQATQVGYPRERIFQYIVKEIIDG